MYMDNHLHAKKCILIPYLYSLRYNPHTSPWPFSLLEVSYPADFSVGKRTLGCVGSVVLEAGYFCWTVLKRIVFLCLHQDTQTSAYQSFPASVSVQQAATPSSAKSKSNFYRLIGILMETNSRTGEVIYKWEAREHNSFWLSGIKEETTHDEFSRNFVTKIYPERWLIQQHMDW